MFWVFLIYFLLFSHHGQKSCWGTVCESFVAAAAPVTPPVWISCASSSFLKQLCCSLCSQGCRIPQNLEFIRILADPRTCKKGLGGGELFKKSPICVLGLCFVGIFVLWLKTRQEIKNISHFPLSWSFVEPQKPSRSSLSFTSTSLFKFFHSRFNLFVLPSFSQCCEAEQTANRHCSQLGRGAPPRQKIRSFRILLRQRHRPGHPGAPQVWALSLTAFSSLFLFYSLFLNFFSPQNYYLELPKGIYPAEDFLIFFF